MTELSARQVLHRFTILTALRWLPTGLLIPVMVLLPLDRGVGLAEIGLAWSMQGFVVLLLELPTGGLADSIGRRPVLVASTALSIASIAVLAWADSFWWLVLVAALQGVYRALDSGPLEAWYVDTAQAADPDARIEAGMSAHGTVVGVGIATGAILSGGLVALEPIPGVNPLLIPVLVSLGIQVVGAVAIQALMVEHRPMRADGLRASIRQTPRTIAAGFGLLRSSHVLLALVCVELFWGFGMATFETLFPVRLAETVGGTEAAAALTGPAASAAWLASAAGAACVAWLARRLGMAPVAALMRILQGAFVICMGLFAGAVGLVAAYLACYTVHGASGAAHMSLLHRQATGEVRATVVSLNSMAAQPAGALGLICLTALAEGVSTSVAMYVGGVILALAAPLYLPAWRQARQARQARDARVTRDAPDASDRVVETAAPEAGGTAR